MKERSISAEDDLEELCKLCLSKSSGTENIDNRARKETYFSISTVELPEEKDGKLVITCQSNKWEVFTTTQVAASLCWKIIAKKKETSKWADNSCKPGDTDSATRAAIRFTLCPPRDIGKGEAFPKGQPGYSSSGKATIADNFFDAKEVEEINKNKPFFVSCIDGNFRVLQNGEILFSAPYPNSHHALIASKNIEQLTIEAAQYMDAFSQ